MKTENKALLVRLRPETKELLDKAAIEQRRSRASIVDELIREAYERKFNDVQVRLSAMLGQR